MYTIPDKRSRECNKLITIPLADTNYFCNLH